MPLLETLAVAAKEVGAVAAETAKMSVETVKNISETGVKETLRNQVENIKSTGDAVLSKLDDIKNLTPEQLREKMEENLSQRETENNFETGEEQETREGLTDEEKAKIKEETGWSDEIVDAIGSMEEYEIYKKAGLIEAEISGKKCLIRTDIDWNQTYIDSFTKEEKTNADRIKEGLAPIDKNGKPIQLHHIGQHANSPLAELTFEEHRSNGNHNILHDNSKSTEIHGEGSSWDSERKEYWENRSKFNGGNGNERNC